MQTGALRTLERSRLFPGDPLLDHLLRLLQGVPRVPRRCADLLEVRRRPHQARQRGPQAPPRFGRIPQAAKVLIFRSSVDYVAHVRLPRPPAFPKASIVEIGDAEFPRERLSFYRSLANATSSGVSSRISVILQMKRNYRYDTGTTVVCYTYQHHCVLIHGITVLPIPYSRGATI